MDAREQERFPDNAATKGRRRILLFGGLLGLASGVFGRARPAQAQEGQPFLLGTTNTANETTALDFRGGPVESALKILSGMAAAAVAGKGKLALVGLTPETYLDLRQITRAGVESAAVFGGSDTEVGVWGRSLTNVGAWGFSQDGIGVKGVTRDGPGIGIWAYKSAVDLPRPEEPAAFHATATRDFNAVCAVADAGTAVMAEASPTAGIALHAMAQVAAQFMGRVQLNMAGKGVVRAGSATAMIQCPGVTENSHVQVTFTSEARSSDHWIELMAGKGAVLHLPHRAHADTSFTYAVFEALPMT